MLRCNINVNSKIIDTTIQNHLDAQKRRNKLVLKNDTVKFVAFHLSTQERNAFRPNVHTFGEATKTSKNLKLRLAQDFSESQVISKNVKNRQTASLRSAFLNLFLP